MASFASIWSSLEQAGHPPPFMLIDCAGIDGGQARIPKEAFSELECLFTGDLAIELANVGPYLARLKSYEPEVRDVAEELLGQHVALLVVLPATDIEQTEITFSQMHRHFRKFNVVYDPSGKPLFFRYYDPRVLVDVLAALKADQLDAFFGSSETLVLMDQSGQATRCRRDGGTLTVLA